MLREEHSLLFKNLLFQVSFLTVTKIYPPTHQSPYDTKCGKNQYVTDSLIRKIIKNIRIDRVTALHHNQYRPLVCKGSRFDRSFS